MKFKVTFWNTQDSGTLDLQADLDKNVMIDLPNNTYEFFEVLNQYSDSMMRWVRFIVNLNSSPPEICFMNQYD